MRKNKSLNDKHTLINTEFFPYEASAKGGHRVVLGIGGNIGDVLRRFGHLFWVLKRSSFLRVLKTTPILKNPAFGYTKQEDFLNALVLIETKLSPKVLLRYILRIEKKFGRKRSFKDAPRTLDIDMIFYGNIEMKTKTLILPHPGWRLRDSVLIPLGYLS